MIEIHNHCAVLRNVFMLSQHGLNITDDFRHSTGILVTHTNGFVDSSVCHARRVLQ